MAEFHIGGMQREYRASFRAAGERFFWDQQIGRYAGARLGRVGDEPFYVGSAVFLGLDSWLQRATLLFPGEWSHDLLARGKDFGAALFPVALTLDWLDGS